MDYLGTRPCGCAIAWCSGDSPQADTARAVSDMIRDGLDVERVTTEEARRRIGWCPAHRAERAVKQESLAL